MGVSYLACVPVDINEHTNGELPRWVPSIEHTLIQCEVCGRNMWIGPKQTEFSAQHPDAMRICMHCAVILQDLTGMPVNDLGGQPGRPRV